MWNIRYTAVISLYISLLFLFLTLFFSGCAIQSGGPEGGPKDVTPPQVKGEYPANGSVNFSSNEITIALDEYIALDNPYQEVIITPTLPERPDIHVRKKSVVIDFGDMPLKPNTTYSLQFGNAIKDVNEGNVMAGYTYVFSTGPYLDSLEVSGAVVAALSGKAAEKYKVMLYDPQDDTSLIKGKPLYYSLTSSAGSFSIGHLPPGAYRVVALEDKNNNFTLEKGEKLAFADSVLRLSNDSAAPLVLNAFEFATPGVDLISASYTGVSLQLKFSGSVDSLALISRGTIIPAKRWLNETKDSVVYWFRDSSFTDTFHIRAVSSTGGLDTFLATKPVRAAADPFTYEVVSGPESLNEYNAPLLLKANRPVKRIDTAALEFFMSDSIPLKLTHYSFLDSSHTRVGLFYPFIQDSLYRFQFYPGVLVSEYNEVKRDTVKIGMQLPPKSNFGTLEIRLKVPSPGGYLFQLVDENGRIVAGKEMNQMEDTLSLPYVTPGNYRMRFVVDRNNNGRWDRGQLKGYVQPEKVIYGPTVSAKANWEMLDLRFDISSQTP